MKVHPLYTFAAALITLMVAACYSEPPADPITPSLAPIVRLDRERGQSLYRENCSSCHGAQGHGDGHRVPQLNGPKPRDFHDAALLNTMTPADAFRVIGNGVAGTAMVAFPLLEPNDRWHLAFYVLSFMQTEEAAKRGQERVAQSDRLRPSLRKLAGADNRELTTSMWMQRGKTPIPQNVAADIVAYLRNIAPYEQYPYAYERFRDGLAQAITEYRQGEHSAAVATLSTSTLDHLGGPLRLMRLHHSGQSLAIEQQLGVLKELLSRGEPVSAVQAQAQQVDALLDTATTTMFSSGSHTSGLWDAVLLILQYGSDGAVCLFFLFLVTMRRGADRNDRKAVAFGAIAGTAFAVAGVLAWPSLTSILSGRMRIFLILVASAALAALLLYLLASTVRHIRNPPWQRSVAPPSWLVLLFILTAITLVRDTLEYSPALHLLLQHGGSNVLLGALEAILGLGMFVLFSVVVTRKLPTNMQTCIVTTSATVAAILSAGGAMRAAQAIGILPSSLLGTVQIPVLSFWPTSQGILAQLVIACAATLILIVLTVMGTKAKPSK